MLAATITSQKVRKSPIIFSTFREGKTHFFSCFTVQGYTLERRKTPSISHTPSKLHIAMFPRRREKTSHTTNEPLFFLKSLSFIILISSSSSTFTQLFNTSTNAIIIEVENVLSSQELLPTPLPLPVAMSLTAPPPPPTLTNAAKPPEKDPQCTEFSFTMTITTAEST